MTAEAAGPRALSSRERAGLVALLVLILAFGAMTVFRSAFLQGRHTDADVYFRAAWAVQSGSNIYKVVDTNGWHYHYPPLLAILLVPFADPPEDAPPDKKNVLLPYPVSVTAWYIISVIILCWALHLLASAIEATSPDSALGTTVRFERRWWAFRVMPVLICMPMIGYTLGRGQVNFLLLLALCGMCASMLRGRQFQAGMWLAFGACIKAYLIALFIYPLLRRRWRWVAGFVAGMFIGLVLVPMVALGPARTGEVYRDLYELRLKGLVTGDLHPDIVQELDVLRGQFPTYGAVFFKAFNPDPNNWPSSLPRIYSIIQLAIGGALVALTLLAAGLWKRAGEARLFEVLVPGAILLGMLPAISTCKPHYYSLAILPVMGMIALIWERRGEPVIGKGWWVFFGLYFVANFLSEVPQVVFLHGGGLAPIASILLWLACTVQMVRLSRSNHTEGTS